ncbi:DUF5959 family protein [Streptomyces sp. PanSC19]|uniref:DUF5959 family protein n=1 Tax=Streptomyces sp. PanSC19 TaxID=1520455 RepID=UPI0037DA1C7F
MAPRAFGGLHSAAVSLTPSPPAPTARPAARCGRSGRFSGRTAAEPRSPATGCCPGAWPPGAVHDAGCGIADRTVAGNSVRITVLGPLQGVSGGPAAEIVVNTPFVSGRVGLSLWRSRLTSWGEALARLESGEDIARLHVQRGPSVSIHLNGKRGLSRGGR